jgi:hypothetical protein
MSAPQTVYGAVQRRQRAEEAAQQLTPGMVQSALTELLWHTGNYPKSHGSLVSVPACWPTDCNAYLVHVLPAQQH